MNHRQAGFTLVEIAIVLVIIGLLLGGVLKGQELINSAKSKAVINDFRNTATMIAAYQDRFRALPGDDSAVTSHLTGATLASTPTGTGNGVGNGLIGGDWNSSAVTDESVLMWQHLRLANLSSGDTSPPTSATLDAWRPKNSEGGIVGVQSLAPVTGWTGRQFVCQGNVSGRIAQQVDTTMDDGRANQGSVRFGTYATPTLTPATTVDENALYTVCASY